MSDFAEKAKTIGTMRRRGTTKTTVIKRDDDGTVAGVQKEHWSDRVDAVAMPKPVRMKLNLNQED